MAKNKKMAPTCPDGGKSYTDAALNTTKCCPKSKEIVSLATSNASMNANLNACCAKDEKPYLNLYNYAISMGIKSIEMKNQQSLSSSNEIEDLPSSTACCPSNKKIIIYNIPFLEKSRLEVGLCCDKSATKIDIINGTLQCNK